MSFFNREEKPRQGGPHVAMKDLFRLDGRTTIITGGGGALGMAAASAILESGGDVVCLDSRSPPKELWDDIQTKALQYEGKIFHITCDVTSEPSVSQSFQAAQHEARYPIRGLVTCAGIGTVGAAEDLPLEEFKRIHDVNVVGTLLCAQAFAKLLRGKSDPSVGGSIVLIASMSGHIVNRGLDMVAYNSSKAAVHQMTRNLACEWASNASMPLIRVNSLSPGYIETPLTAAVMDMPEMEKLWKEDNMLLRVSKADEYRGAIVYMLSDASSFMTAADLRVDGGHTAW